MTSYKLRDDIVIGKVDKIIIFVALRSAWDVCPFAVQSSPASALIWEKLKEGFDEEQILQALIKEKNMSIEQAEKIFHFFIRKSKEFHYLIEESDQC